MRWGSAAAVVILIGMVALLFSGWSPWAWTSLKRHAEIDAAGVRLALDSDDVVAVRRSAVERIDLFARTKSWWGEDEQSWHRDGETLVLDGCGWRCTVDYELVIPPGTRIEGETESGSVNVNGAESVDVETGSGSIVLRNVAGAVTASTGSGSVLLAQIGGSSTVRSSSGSITGRALAGPVDAQTSSGHVLLGLTRQQNVRAETSSGNVRLIVPAGNYRVDARSASGDEDKVWIGVVDDPKARYALNLTTSSGTVSVRQR